MYPLKSPPQYEFYAFKLLVFSHNNSLITTDTPILDNYVIQALVIISIRGCCCYLIYGLKLFYNERI